MRNLAEYPLTQEEKNKLILQDGAVGSIEPYAIMKLATEFAAWLWTTGVEYQRGGTYSVSRYSGLDSDKTYTMEELYGFWLNTFWLKHDEKV